MNRLRNSNFNEYTAACYGYEPLVHTTFGVLHLSTSYCSLNFIQRRNKQAEIESLLHAFTLFGLDLCASCREFEATANKKIQIFY